MSMEAFSEPRKIRAVRISGQHCGSYLKNFVLKLLNVM